MDGRRQRHTLFADQVSQAALAAAVPAPGQQVTAVEQAQAVAQARGHLWGCGGEGKVGMSRASFGRGKQAGTCKQAKAAMACLDEARLPAAAARRVDQPGFGRLRLQVLALRRRRPPQLAQRGVAEREQGAVCRESECVVKAAGHLRCFGG